MEFFVGDHNLTFKLDRDYLKHTWFSSKASDDEKLDALFDLIELGKTKEPETQELTPGQLRERRAQGRVAMVKLLRGKIEEAEDTLEDMAMDVAVECGVDPNDLDTEDKLNAGMEFTHDLITEAKRFLGIDLLPNGVYVLISFTSEHNWEDVELFSERPRTPHVTGNIAEWANWPTRYELRLGNIDGGDSIVLEVDREMTDSGWHELHDVRG